MTEVSRKQLRGRARQRGEWATLWLAFGLFLGIGAFVVMLSLGQLDSLFGLKKSRFLDIPPLPQMVQEGYEPLTREQAIAANAALAISSAPVERANPFTLPSRTGAGNLGALDCLTAAVYYEAANEPDVGQRGVAQVVINRMRHPAFPKSICGVVFQGSERRTGCQFSFTCDGSLSRMPSAGGWARARRVALMALSGFVEPMVGTATHYHAYYVMPYWAPTLDKVAVVGAHIFYRWKGYWGKRNAFVGRYSGVEQMPLRPGTAPPPATDAALVLPGSPLTPDAATTSAPAVPKLINPVEQDRSGASLATPRSTPIQADQDRGQLHIDQSKGVLDPDVGRR